MSEPLPTSNFKWMDDPSAVDWMSVDACGDIGYVLEVDLEYPPT